MSKRGSHRIPSTAVQSQVCVAVHTPVIPLLCSMETGESLGHVGYQPD